MSKMNEKINNLNKYKLLIVTALDEKKKKRNIYRVKIQIHPSVVNRTKSYLISKVTHV